MKPARILLLVVAIVAGGLAAYLATRGQGPAPVQQVAQVIEEPKSQVLVASRTLGVGERLDETAVTWQDWPEGAVRPEYITSAVVPDAIEQMLGTVARFEIFNGEPIRSSKLVRTDQGYLSAVIEEGMRAVSIPVSAASSAGGFIVPNDRVDVVKTVDQRGGPISTTILSNVKVLALGQRIGQTGPTGGASEGEDEAEVQQFLQNSIATLELNPTQSELIISAVSDGNLSLVLRSVVDFDAPPGEGLGTKSQAITLIRGGSSSSIQSNAVASITSTDDGTVAPSQIDSKTRAVVEPIFQKAGMESPGALPAPPEELPDLQ